MSWFFGGEGTIDSVVQQTAEKAFTESTIDHIKWEEPSYSSVETQTFYLLTDDGHVLLLQMIYSSVRFAFTTRQFSVKLFYPASKDGSPTKEPFWDTRPIDSETFTSSALADVDVNRATGLADGAKSDPAESRADADHDFDKANDSLRDADVKLNKAGNTFTIRSKLNGQSPEVRFTFSKDTPGLLIGNDGSSVHKTASRVDGHIRHVFWPRCSASGTITLADGQSVSLSGRGIFVHALQGMMPNHAASRWNFLGFQSPSYSALVMEFTGTDYYKNPVVTVGMVTDKTKIIVAGGSPAVEVVKSEVDPETDWPTPTEVRCVLNGAPVDGVEKTTAVIEGEIGKYTSRIDVLGELPAIAKTVVSSLSGVRPYVYQYVPTLSIKVTTGEAGSETTVEEQGTVLFESSFIS